MKDSIKPSITIGRTNARISDQGYNYNQSGFTYNQSGVEYGGVYGQDISPLIARTYKDLIIQSAHDSVPQMVVGRTNAQIEDQGYTYNQPLFTYNEAGVLYGGVYGYDVQPLMSTARKEKIKIIFGADFGATVIPPAPTGNSGMLIGMLGMLYP